MYTNYPGQTIDLYVVDVSTGLPKTGDAANLTASVEIDDGGVNDLADTTATEIDATKAPGKYRWSLSQAETNGYKLGFSGRSSAANVIVLEKCIYTEPDPSYVQDSNVIKWLDNDVPATNVNGVPIVDVGYVDGTVAVPILGADVLATGTIANAADTAIDLGTLTYGDNELADYLIRVLDVSTGEYHSQWISSNAAATSIATLAAALPFTTESGVDTWTLLAIRRDVTASVSLGAGSITSSTFAAGAINAAAIADGAIDAATFAASALDAVWSTTTRTLTAGTNINGSTFTAIPWNAAWDAEVQSECEDAIAAITLQVTAIKLKTDNLPASPAAVGSAMTLTSGERTAIASAYLSSDVETGVTVLQYMQRTGATAAGKISGAGTTTEIFVGMDGATVRVTATVDEFGNRSAIAYG